MWSSYQCMVGADGDLFRRCYIALGPAMALGKLEIVVIPKLLLPRTARPSIPIGWRRWLDVEI
jgi:hypothetical protein